MEETGRSLINVIIFQRKADCRLRWENEDGHQRGKSISLSHTVARYAQCQCRGLTGTEVGSISCWRWWDRWCTGRLLVELLPTLPESRNKSLITEAIFDLFGTVTVSSVKIEHVLLSNSCSFLFILILISIMWKLDYPALRYTDS